MAAIDGPSVPTDDAAFPRRIDHQRDGGVVRCVLRALKALVLLPIAPVAKLAAAGRASVAIDAASHPRSLNARTTHRTFDAPASSAWSARGGSGDGRAQAASAMHASGGAASRRTKRSDASRERARQEGARSQPAAPLVRAPSGTASSGAPSRVQILARQQMIRRLVWLDTEGLIKRLLRAGYSPWTSQGSLEGDLRRRSPLIEWHVRQNVLPSEVRSLRLPQAGRVSPPRARSRAPLHGQTTPTPEPAASAPSAASTANAARSTAARRSRARIGGRRRARAESDRHARSAARAGGAPATPATTPDDARTAAAGASGGGTLLPMAKNLELKDAIMEVVPAFFALVGDAARRDPASAPRLYRRVASASALLLYWRTGRLFKLSEPRQYARMNGLLRQVTLTVAECQSILGCDGDDECVVDAIESVRNYQRRFDHAYAVSERKLEAKPKAARGKPPKPVSKPPKKAKARREAAPPRMARAPGQELSPSLWLASVSGGMLGVPYTPPRERASARKRRKVLPRAKGGKKATRGKAASSSSSSSN